MKIHFNRLNDTKTRFLTVLAFSLALVFVPATVSAKDKEAHLGHQDRAELRIKDMHAKLKITAQQERLWTNVELAMREDAKVMDSLTEARMAHAKDMTAVDDLKSYAEISTAHAEGIKKLTPVFSELYDSMSVEQKKQADELFRHHKHQRGMHKQIHTKLEDNS